MPTANDTLTGSIVQDYSLAVWGNLSTIEGIFGVMIFLLLIFGIINMLFLYIWFQGRRSFNIAKNLRRRIYFASSLSGSRLQTEFDIINNNKLYTVVAPIVDIENNCTFFQNKSNIAIVIEYDPLFTHYNNLLLEAQNNNFAIIVYSKNPTAITPSHRDLFQTYPYFEMCNSIGRIMSSLYNLLSIMPYGKK